MFLLAYSKRQYMGFRTSWDSKKNHSLKGKKLLISLVGKKILKIIPLLQ